MALYSSIPDFRQHKTSAKPRRSCRCLSGKIPQSGCGRWALHHLFLQGMSDNPQICIINVVFTTAHYSPDPASQHRLRVTITRAAGRPPPYPATTSKHDALMDVYLETRVAPESFIPPRMERKRSVYGSIAKLRHIRMERGAPQVSIVVYIVVSFRFGTVPRGYTCFLNV